MFDNSLDKSLGNLLFESTVVEKKMIDLRINYCGNMEVVYQ